MHTVEIDDDIMMYLKSKADPFVDTTPNSVLRRELLKRSPSVPGRVPGTTSTSSELGRHEPAVLPMLPRNLPEALRQTLEVAYLVRESRRNRNEATSFVAQHHRIARETVADKYCRQLGLTATGIDMLLAEPNLSGLQQKLESKFPNHHADIADFLRRLRR